MRTSYWFEFGGEHKTADLYGTDFLPELRRIAQAQIVRNGQEILEWGTGLSTLLLSDIAAERGARMVTLDTNADYQKAVCRQVLHPSVLTTYTLNVTGPTKGNADQGLNYSTFPLILDKEFDLVLIDGRRRVECALVAALMCREDSLVLIHDYRRRRYQVALALYDIVEDGPQFRVLRPRSEILARRGEMRARFRDFSEKS